MRLKKGVLMRSTADVFPFASYPGHDPYDELVTWRRDWFKYHLNVKFFLRCAYWVVGHVNDTAENNKLASRLLRYLRYRAGRAGEYHQMYAISQLMLEYEGTLHIPVE